MNEHPVFPLDGPCSRESVAPYCERVRAKVAPRRFEHILRVAALAESIARSNGFDEGEIRAVAQAAILHDAARDLSPRALFELAPPESPEEQEVPLAVHGRAARVLAEGWGVNDARVLEAVEGHVFGVALGHRVGMAVYVADVSEPGRGVNEDVRELAMRNLPRAYRRAVDRKVRYLRSKGLTVHPRTLQVHQEIANPT